MKTDSILKTPLRGGLVLERVVTGAGDVTITITDDAGEAVYSEEIIHRAGAATPAEEAQDAEPVL